MEDMENRCGKFPQNFFGPRLFPHMGTGTSDEQMLALPRLARIQRPMRRIDRPELRFLVKRGVQALGRGVLRDLAGSSNVRLRALESATDTIVERLDHLEYEAPDPLAPHHDRSKPANARQGEG